MLKRSWGNFRDLMWPSVATPRGQQIAITAGLVAALLMFWEASANLIGRAHTLSVLTKTHSPLLATAIEHTAYNALYALLIVLCGFFLRIKRSRIAAAGLCLVALYAPGGTLVLYNLNAQLMPALRSPLRIALLAFILLLALNGLRGAWAWQRRGRFAPQMPALEKAPRSWGRIIGMAMVVALGALGVWNGFLAHPPVKSAIKSEAAFYEECLARPVQNFSFFTAENEAVCRPQAFNRYQQERWMKEGGYFASIRVRLEEIAFTVGFGLIFYGLIFGLYRREKAPI